VRLLLDTVALIFAVESPERFTKRSTAILQNTENILELSAISLSEIAIKAARGKLKFSAADTRRALEDLDLRVDVQRESEYLTEFTVYTTALSMNYLIRGKFIHP